jgi:membrane-bound ClpP family serine protease
LNTPGGSVEAVDDMVNIVRKHYEEVYFVVPDYAMSAGTIFCMSGDKIYMDYSSSLGPIDPQVWNGEQFVPALNYLAKVDELLEKAKNKELTDVEFVMLQNLDLAQLKSYEQAKDLTIDLLKEWLVKFKFKSWKEHRTDIDKKGEKVTRKEKELRAEEIATALNNTDKWRSHNRSVDIEDLKEIRLEIDDYSHKDDLRKLIREYNDLLIDFIDNQKFDYFMHSKKHF